MAKPHVVEQRFDFRGGRNTAISTDLLNPNELVDCTNARLSNVYGGFSKRSGSQRIHSTAFPASVQGVTQWDGPNGKQIVAISNGKLYYRDGFDFSAGFIVANNSSIARTTQNQDATDPPNVAGSWGWTDADGADDGKGADSFSGNDPVNTSNTKTGVLIMKVGDPHVNNNIVAVDNNYTLKFKASLSNTGHGSLGQATLTITIESSINGGGSWQSVAGSYGLTVGTGSATQTFNPTVNIAAGAQLWFRLNMVTTASYTDDPGIPGLGTYSVASSVQCFGTTYRVDNFPTTWTGGQAAFSLNQPTFFAPFRAFTAGSPLVLYIASGGHLFSWTGTDVPSNGLVQLDPTNSAPTATNIISYHTRLFAMTASSLTPGTTPKTIYWSKLGDATDFTTGDKTKGGSAVTDFLTGQQLTALEVIGSSLLMTTADSVMRFTGHASDDIVIAQDTEGVTAEVGPVGPQAIKRFENVAAMFTDRGPYAVTETYAEPSGEQLNPDWRALDNANLSKTIVEYNRGRKELLFAVPGINDGGTPKTIFCQSVRLQAWQGPWTYPFTISCMAKYFDSTNSPNVLAGSTDGFVRLMDIGTLDDVLFDGTSGTNITLTVEFPVFHFGMPGIKKAMRWMILQADLPTISTPSVNIAFDGSSFTNFPITPNDTGEEDYRVDVAGDSSQGFRLRLQFTDNSSQMVVVNGFTLVGWNMQRTT